MKEVLSRGARLVAKPQARATVWPLYGAAFAMAMLGDTVFSTIAEGLPRQVIKSRLSLCGARLI
jgi:hypothetical protein